MTLSWLMNVPRPFITYGIFFYESILLIPKEIDLIYFAPADERLEL